jgi:hypothetical protein
LLRGHWFNFGQGEADLRTPDPVLERRDHRGGVRVQGGEVTVEQFHLVHDLGVGDVLRALQVQDVEHQGDQHFRLVLTQVGVLQEFLDLLFQCCPVVQDARVGRDHLVIDMVCAANMLRALRGYGGGQHADCKGE